MFLKMKVHFIVSKSKIIVIYWKEVSYFISFWSNSTLVQRTFHKVLFYFFSVFLKDDIFFSSDVSVKSLQSYSCCQAGWKFWKNYISKMTFSVKTNYLQWVTSTEIFRQEIFVELSHCQSNTFLSENYFGKDLLFLKESNFKLPG